MSNPGAVAFSTTENVRDHCLCLHVQSAARTLARRFDGALRPFNLTNGQFSLLMSLNRPRPPSIGSVAALLVMDRTTLTAAVKPLKRRRLLKIVADPTDRRGRLLSLTRGGHALLARAVPVWEHAHAKLESLVGRAGANSLRDKLRALS
jgi:DNA-binding MarR family transcriptional regulator